jgi:putative ABC transport system permease protein
MKKPGFTAVAVLVLGLGIGATTVIFSAFNAVLLESLPYKDAEKLIFIYHSYPAIKLDQASVCVPCYQEYRDLTNSFEQVATASFWPVNHTGVGEPKRLIGQRVTHNYFTTLGIEPAQGRAFRPEDDQPGSDKVVILSHPFWQERFGGDAGLLNNTITLDGESYTVVGIMPESFKMPQPIELWKPIAFTQEQLAPANHGNEFLNVIARMKPGVTIEQAQTEMNALADQLRPQFYGPESTWGIKVKGLREQLLGDFRLMLVVLMVAVGCVLLIACANVANLLLARATSRQKEIAVRTALGASRARTVRQLLTESALLGVLGGLVGLAVAYLGIRLLVLGIPPDVANTLLGWREIGINFKVLGFALGVSLLTGLLFGIAPALQSSKNDLNESLKEGGRSGSEGPRRNRVRGALVVFEVAIALVLLVAAGLLIRSFMRLQEVSPGFNPNSVVTMNLSLPQYKYQKAPERVTFYDQSIQRIKALPGVEYAAYGSNLPMTGNVSSASFSVEGYMPPPGESSPHGDIHTVSSGYFEALQVPLIHGRYFNESDTASSLPVAIIDEKLAERYWPNENPVGKRIAALFDRDGQNLRWREIVGVVGHIKQRGLDGIIKEQYYFPVTQRTMTNLSLVVRASTDPLSLVGSVRNAISEIDPEMPVFRVTTLDQYVSNSLAQKRFLMFLVAIFASVALLLAAVGLYGVMSYSVTQRTHEIGIRMALGASSSDVLGMIIRQGMMLTLIGLGIGVIGAYLLTRLLASVLPGVLFGVGPNDPITFIALSIVLALVTLLASYIPARRATRVDPMVALRYE